MGVIWAFSPSYDSLWSPHFLMYFFTKKAVLKFFPIFSVIQLCLNPFAHICNRGVYAGRGVCNFSKAETNRDQFSIHRSVPINYIGIILNLPPGNCCF